MCLSFSLKKKNSGWCICSPFEARLSANRPSVSTALLKKQMTGFLFPILTHAKCCFAPKVSKCQGFPLFSHCSTFQVHHKYFQTAFLWERMSTVLQIKKNGFIEVFVCGRGRPGPFCSALAEDDQVFSPLLQLVPLMSNPTRHRGNTITEIIGFKLSFKGLF